MTGWACACRNLKELEVVAPDLAKPHYSWLGDRGRWTAASQPRQPPSSSSASTRAHAARGLPGKHSEQAPHAASTVTAKKWAKLEREKGREGMKKLYCLLKGLAVGMKRSENRCLNA